jgi:glutamate-1-semialdehyde 2,1-aminomutase
LGARELLTASLTDTRSAELYRRALRVLPGGVNSPVRAMRSIGRDPVFVERAEGAELTDVDGNTYVDYVCSWGPLIHGHAFPPVLAAVAAAAEKGTTFGAPTAAEVELAEEVARRVPSVEMLRMTSSGTEASMSAIRLARAATGRDTLIKFAGAYHGHVDGLLAEAGSGLATQGIPASPGVPEAVAAATIVVPWNDPEAITAAVEQHEPAAILAEPYPANMGLVPPQPRFLELLRELATDSGALLVFDEVISGFRVSTGGAQELSGVIPDLTVMGKVIGGGLPAAAYGGPVELLERIAPAGDVYQAGTLSGNPLAVAAGLAALQALDEESYLQLAETTRSLAAGLREAAGSRPVQVAETTGLLTVFFSAEPVTDYAGAAACDTEAHAAWCRALLARGVYPPPSQFEAWFPSLAHTPEHVERTVEAAAAAFGEIA